jgi:hypothetical protein
VTGSRTGSDVSDAAAVRIPVAAASLSPDGRYGRRFMTDPFLIAIPVRRPVELGRDTRRLARSRPGLLSSVEWLLPEAVVFLE